MVKEQRKKGYTSFVDYHNEVFFDAKELKSFKHGITHGEIKYKDQYTIQ